MQRFDEYDFTNEGNKKLYLNQMVEHFRFD